MVEHYSEKLAKYVISQSYTKLPPKTVEHAKWLLLDAIGVSIAGADKKWAKAVLSEVRRQGGNQQSTIWLHGDKVSDVSASCQPLRLPSPKPRPVRPGRMSSPLSFLVTISQSA